MRENEDRNERKKEKENIYFVNRCRHSLQFFLIKKKKKKKKKKKVLTAVIHNI